MSVRQRDIGQADARVYVPAGRERRGCRKCHDMSCSVMFLVCPLALCAACGGRSRGVACPSVRRSAALPRKSESVPVSRVLRARPRAGPRTEARTRRWRECRGCHEMSWSGVRFGRFRRSGSFVHGASVSFRSTVPDASRSPGSRPGQVRRASLFRAYRVRACARARAGVSRRRGSRA